MFLTNATGKAIRMNTVSVGDGHCDRKNQCTKNKRKTRSESRDIDENDISQCLGETFLICRQLASE